MENIDIDIDIDKDILENIDIDIDIDKDILENIDIDKGVIKIPIKQWCKMGAKSDHFCPFSAYLGVFSPVLLMEYRIFISIVDISANFKNIGIDIDIDKEILENIDIDKISNRLEFGISNRAKPNPTNQPTIDTIISCSVINISTQSIDEAENPSNQIHDCSGMYSTND